MLLSVAMRVSYEFKKNDDSWLMNKCWFSSCYNKQIFLTSTFILYLKFDSFFLSFVYISIKFQNQFMFFKVFISLFVIKKIVQRFRSNRKNNVLFFKPYPWKPQNIYLTILVLRNSTLIIEALLRIQYFNLTYRLSETNYQRCKGGLHYRLATKLEF